MESPCVEKLMAVWMDGCHGDEVFFVVSCCRETTSFSSLKGLIAHTHHKARVVRCSLPFVARIVESTGKCVCFFVLLLT